MRRVLIAVFLIALTTLMMELVLTRTFDVILSPNMAYMVVTCALFAFGLAGIHMTLWPVDLPTIEALCAFLLKRSIAFAVLTALILPAINLIPFDYDGMADQIVLQVVYFGLIYLVLVGPFFVAGQMLAAVFSSLTSRIQTLYFFDLAGAAIGCVILIPFVPMIGPGGLLLCSSGLGLITASVLAPRRSWAVGLALLAMALVAVPFLRMPEYFDFEPKRDKRGLLEAIRENRVEFTRWDPVSKIDVVDTTEVLPDGGFVPGSRRKHVAYDGGSQSTHIFHFDGDLPKLRTNLREELINQFWNPGVLGSHYFRRDSGQRVLIIGSAGGQETKAALMFGAAAVDAIEMVGTVVDVGLHRYADYNGRVFLDPRVKVRVGEGRSVLRASDDRYDIIQIYSNHTSSSIAAGTGAMSTSYLQTVDAYREYFDHLTDDGILHINHHIYPKIVATAARAWNEMGRPDFRRHVVAFKREGEDTLPTLLIRMRPWTEQEIEELKDFFFVDYAHVEQRELLVEDPFHPESSFLSPEFFSGTMSPELLATLSYRCAPPTDDKPYFNFLRRQWGVVEVDEAHYTDEPIAQYLNSSLRGERFPMDVMHLVITAAVSLVFAGGFILIPLWFSKAGRAEWPSKFPTIAYFSCLGAGFIIIELVFIQIFMKLIGPPLHTYSTVLFTVLLAASMGSAFSKRLNAVNWGWRLPFIAVLGTGALLLLTYPLVFDLCLGFSLPIRILVAAALIFPLGFFLGMPFPLGILLLEQQPRGAIAWAWGLNGLFTVIGGLASVLLSIFLGFRLTLIVAFLIYGLALAMLSRMRSAGRVPGRYTVTDASVRARTAAAAR